MRLRTYENSSLNGKENEDLRPSVLLRREFFLKRFKSARALVFLVVLGACYTLLAYRGDGLTIGGDCLLPFHPTEYLSRIKYVSDPWAGFGSSLPPIFSLPPLPDTLLFSAFTLSGLDIYAANKLYVFILATLSSISIYYLLTTIFNDNDKKSWMGAVAVFAYLFNPWSYSDTYKTMVFMELSLVQTGFILFIAFVIKYFRTTRIKYSLYAGLCTFLTFSYPGVSAYRLGFLALLGYIYIAAYYMVRNHKGRLKRSLLIVFKGAAILVLLGFLINSYWVIPFVQSAGYYASFASGFQTRNVFNEYSTMTNTLRLLNSWSFYGGFVPFAATYLTNTALILLTFVWPVFAFLPLFSKRINKVPKVLAVYVATLLAILLSWGSEFPLGGLYMAMANIHLGPYYFFRPFYNIGLFSQLVLTVEYAILIGLLSSLVLWPSTRNKQGFHLCRRELAGLVSVALIVGALALSSWPVLTGEVMRNWYDPKQYGVKVPVAYWEANQYLEKVGDLDHKTLLLPRPEVYIGTSWGYQGTSHFYNLMLNTPLVTGNEIPYGISLNRTMLNHIYAVPYVLSDQNAATDILNQTGRIMPWQSDNVTLGNRFLIVDFNNTFQTDIWHQIELRLLSPQNWLNFTHLAIRLTGEMDFERFQLGVGDSWGYIGWWSTIDRVYRTDGNAYIPIEIEKTITLDDDSVNLLFNLKKPDQLAYQANSVKSIWIQYYVTSDTNAHVQIEGLLAAKAAVNSQYYATFLAENRVKFLLLDLAMTEGARSDPVSWLQTLDGNDSFSLVWHEDTLYIFENSRL